jgi:hypothetical protein
MPNRDDREIPLVGAEVVQSVLGGTRKSVSPEETFCTRVAIWTPDHGCDSAYLIDWAKEKTLSGSTDLLID